MFIGIGIGIFQSFVGFIAATASPWILASGTWNDDGIWDDSASWSDGLLWILAAGIWNDGGVWDDASSWID